ncbi:MAG: type II secretion system F family protein [Verrucomicrobiales bacterium]
MPTFAYSALKPDGSLARGELTANDRGEAMRRLDRSGLQPVSIAVKDAVSSGGVATAVAPGKKRSDGKAEPPAKRGEGGKKAAETKPAAAPKADGAGALPKGPVRLRRKQVILFTEELSDLLSAGLQLEPALRIMESRDELGPLKQVSALLRQKVRDGGSFSASLRSSSPDFGELYCSMAAAGEISGALSVILKRQGQYLKSLADLQSSVITALIYPAFLFVAGMLVSTLFVTFLVPQLASLLKSSNKPLPLPAQIMMGSGDFIKAYWWVILLVVAAVMFAFQKVTTNPVYRPTWDRIRLGLPLVGPILTGRFFVQFLETLANLVDNGLPLLRALELSRDATQNIYVRRLLDQVIGMVGEGGSLAKALKRVGFFPPLMTDMITVGEQTGDLPLALRRTAERYDKELEKKIVRLQAAIPHIVTIFMAILVGMVAYMMITVILESVSSIKVR